MLSVKALDSYVSSRVWQDVLQNIAVCRTQCACLQYQAAHVLANHMRHGHAQAIAESVGCLSNIIVLELLSMLDSIRGMAPRGHAHQCCKLQNQ